MLTTVATTLAAADSYKRNVANDDTDADSDVVAGLCDNLNRGELRRHTQRWATTHGTLSSFTCGHCLGCRRKRDDPSGRLV